MGFVQVTYFGQTVWLPDDERYSWIRSMLARNRWERETFATLSRFLDKETAYVDVGGWIGVLPFWAERIAKRVITLEPDPYCNSTLSELKMQNNSRVEIINAALSDKSSVSLNAMHDFGDSESTVLPLGNGVKFEVNSVKFDAVLAGIDEQKVFVKIDIEGYEYFIGEELKKLSDRKIVGVAFALHPDLFRRSILSGSRLSRGYKVAAATWKLRHSIPGFRLSMTSYERLKFFHFCFGKCLFNQGGLPGKDVLFVPE